MDSAGIGAARLGPVAPAGILASSPSPHRAATRRLAAVRAPDSCNERRNGNRKAVLQVRVQHDGKRPQIARWGAVSLRWRIEATIDDRLTPYQAINATELVQRLLADHCEPCGSKESIEVHHVRALKDLNREAGRRGRCGPD